MGENKKRFAAIKVENDEGRKLKEQINDVSIEDISLEDT